ncbi:membrane protein [Clostridium tetani]|uniref:lactate utilization protein n=1 Tax=Clostridium tetani TaxID=1513 RepID=UPI00100A32AD|nr:lactate utilization protein [Clostridium tetani]RXI50986.1 lactate utilization protein [Clostridium tetani]RXI56998.1 lactate utilization protein [Clostridium tetani]BDR63478.1 membrane protein [Clostridium tetani]BDR68996.1 membrane protein [Clostridium tetani]BEV18553.1 lactate utilization protein [Clostridium tetani]
MDKNIEWYIDKKVQRTIENLEKHNIEAFYVKDEDELKKNIDEMIPKGVIVTVGDSMTLLETGVIDMLRNDKYIYLDKHKEGITSEEKKNIYNKSFTAHTYLSSTNALTESGELYNIDGNGSRVAAMIYGPEQVIIVAGINKIVDNLEEAEKRVRNYAAPLDAKRLGKNTPCAKIGYCVDCKSSERICNYFTVIKGQFKSRIKVIIVNKHLGY